MKLASPVVRLLAVVGATSLLFLALEGVSHLWLAHLASPEAFARYASVHQWQERTGGEQRFSKHVYLGMYPTPGFESGNDRHDARGFRGREIEVPKPEGQFRIVCAGGSTTYGSDVDDFRVSYPDQLEAVLHERGYTNVRTVNSGCPFWSSTESLLDLVTRVLDLEPDLLIVYHGVNDVRWRFVWPPEAYRGDNSGAVLAPPNVRVPPFYEQSTLIRALLVRAGAIQPQIIFERTIVKPAPTLYADRFFGQFGRGTYPEPPFDEVSVMRMLDANPPSFFQRNLELMATSAHHRGARTVLATFAYYPNFGKAPHTASPEYQRALREANEATLAAAAASGASAFDFAARFPADRSLFTDGIHLRPKGNRVKAELFADFLIEHGLIPRP